MEENIVEREGAEAGWCVFSGCEGDDPHLVAFFVGCHKELAVELVQRRDADGESVIFDGGVAPAFLTEDGLVVANDAVGIGALSRACGVSVSSW